MRAVIASLVLLCSAPAARAQEADPLAEGIELFERLHMMEARETLERALRIEGRSPSELGEIYLRLGIIAAADGDLESAERNFLRLLAVDPEARLPPGMSPSVAGAFERARAVWDGAELHVEEIAPPEIEDDEVAVRLVGREDRASMVLALRLSWRLAGRGDYRTMTALGLGPHRFTLDGAEAGQSVEYHAALLGPYQSELARLGSPATPRRAAVRTERELAWYERWYLWAGAGVLVAGVTVALILLLQPDPQTYDVHPRVE